jgi:hypothetical protein
MPPSKAPREEMLNGDAEPEKPKGGTAFPRGGHVDSEIRREKPTARRVAEKQASLKRPTIEITLKKSRACDHDLPDVIGIGTDLVAIFGGAADATAG